MKLSLKSEQWRKIKGSTMAKENGDVDGQTHSVVGGSLSRCEAPLPGWEVDLGTGTVWQCDLVSAPMTL